jgi:hypothetical protein
MGERQRSQQAIMRAAFSVSEWVSRLFRERTEEILPAALRPPTGLRQRAPASPAESGARHEFFGAKDLIDWDER